MQTRRALALAPTRPARLALVGLALAAALTGCSDDTPDTGVTDDGVVETPGEQQDGGLDAPSGDPLAPSPSS